MLIFSFLSHRPDLCVTIKYPSIYLSILWYVDGMFALSLPLEYGASFVHMSGSSRNPQCILSTLQIRAIKQINNSLIQCAVAINGRLNRTYFPPAHLLVQGTVS